MAASDLLELLSNFSDSNSHKKFWHYYAPAKYINHQSPGYFQTFKCITPTSTTRFHIWEYTFFSEIAWEVSYSFCFFKYCIILITLFTSNFPNRKSFWHKGMNLPPWENARLQAWYHKGYIYGWISHNCVYCEPHFTESWFMAQIQQKVIIYADFEILHHKKQSLWID